MSKIDYTFAELCNLITDTGREYENKNRGVKRLQIPSYTFKHYFKDGFPALTNKKLFFKSIVGELEWFLNGITNIKPMVDKKNKIWDKDAYNWYVKHVENDFDEESNKLKFGNGDGTFRLLTHDEFIKLISENDYTSLYENLSIDNYMLGDVGKNYSYQWRNFGGKTDQIVDLIQDMTKDIMSSRLKVNAWNPSEIFETSLPPCHSEFQIIGVPLTEDERMHYYNVAAFYGGYRAIYKDGWNEKNTIQEELDVMETPKFGFELHWNQRSVDTFLGLPYNIASYALLAKWLEAITGFPALGIEGTLKCVHFYDNQYEAVKEMMSRDKDKHKNCQLEYFEIDREEFLSDIAKGIKDFDFNTFKLKGYTSDDAISVEMLAPSKL